MPRGLFITFEGTEGCGKSTQVQRLARRLESLGRTVIVTREPGGTPIGEQIRHLLKFAPEGSGMSAETELLLFAASRAQLVRELIEPQLTAGSIVICDRFFDSTTAYQGAARKLPTAIVEQLNRFAVRAAIPDMTFVIDLDVTTARNRLLRRVRPANTPDRMESEPIDFYKRVAEAYRALARREPTRVVLIDGSRSADQVAAEIWRVAQSKIAKRKSKIPDAV